VKSFMKRMWMEDEGVLSFEWILLLTLLVIGVVGGVTAARDAIVDEFGDVAQAIITLDQSYVILDPNGISVHGDQGGSSAGSNYLDSAQFSDCVRIGASPQQVESGVDGEEG